jgi:hypothetical protein
MSQSTQNVVVSIVPGDLILEGPDEQIRESGKLTLKGIKVLDSRGGETGWSLTTSFPSADKIETALVQSVAGSAPGVTTIAYGTDLVTLASKDDQVGASGSTGGVYVFDVTVYFPSEIDVDAYQLQPFGLN